MQFHNRTTPRNLASKRLLTWSLIASTLVWALVAYPRPAWAVRVVQFEILTDGKLILRGELGDKGSAGPDTVWDYLKTLEFAEPNRQFVPEDERSAADFRIVPDSENPLRATLRGDIRIFARYGGDIRVKELHLIRTRSTDTKWRISPEDVMRTKVDRTIDPAMSVRRVKR